MKNTLLIILCFCGFATYAQKQDYIWLTGYFGSGGYDTSWHYWFGISKFDFNQQQVQLSRDSLGINFSRSNSTISDSTGQNILFYSNGSEIRNSFDEIMPNGDSLGYIDGGWFFNFFGIPAASQYHIVLPNPIYHNQYDFFHCFVDSVNTQNGLSIASKKLLHTTVDMGIANLAGSVIRKNEIFNTDEADIVIAAVKHADGRNWWICTNITNTNCYNIFLFNGIDVQKKNLGCGGTISTRDDIVVERFSPDGNTFVSGSSNDNSIHIFNFDRCEGTMNLRESINFPELAALHSYPSSVEISPNSRYLYVFALERLYQFDLSADSISLTKQTIAIYDDTFHCPFGQYFYQAQLGPDGKIYMNSGNANYCASVIDQPDEAGDSCHFILNYPLPTFIDGLPYYPNYRLGALAGSACDTLTAITPTLSQRERELKVFPNPSSDFVTVDYGYTNWEKGDVDLEITNAAGQLFYSQHLPMYSGFQRLDVTSYANGIYTVAIKRGNTIVATSQFVKK